MFGERENVPRERYTGTEKLRIFHQRHYEQYHSLRETNRVTERLQAMAQHFRLHLHSGYCLYENGLFADERFVYGNTRYFSNLGTETIRITMAIEILQPLLRNDLTDAER